MRRRAVSVLGGGVAGLSAALLLARDGHDVTLVERDRLHVGDPTDAPSLERKGIPHFLQPHAFIPRVIVGGGHLVADVVVDALGRRTPTPTWLAGAGLGTGGVESSDCRVIYYCRY